jgi:hypothetical protein
VCNLSSRHANSTEHRIDKVINNSSLRLLLLLLLLLLQGLC